MFRSVRGRTVLMRAYDKALRQASPHLEVVRFERQRRARRREPAVDQAASFLNEVFVGRELGALVDVSAEVVCDRWGAIVG